MNVLIAFEESQAVCIEFRKRGHEAFSCDTQPCSGGHPEWHLQMDVYEALGLMEWDFIGLHPVCTKITLSGNKHYAPGKAKHNERLESVEWTINLWDDTCKLANMVYMENPMGAMNGDNRLPKPQIIQPYYFGDEAQKTTCLWLKGLPWLYHNDKPNLFGDEVTHVSKGNFYISPSGKKMPSWCSDPIGKDGKKIGYNTEEIKKLRSKTFQGIAKAMAEQWG